MRLFKLQRKSVCTAIVLVAISATLIAIPGFDSGRYAPSGSVKAKVLSVDDSSIYQTGIILQGDQYCELLIQDGAHSGQTVRGANKLIGKLELDKRFVPGDSALIALDFQNGQIIEPVTIIDHYRLTAELWLFGGFVLLLVAFAGLTGFNALLSFVVTVLCVWKLLLPAILAGFDPISISMAITIGLTCVIIFAIGGFTRKGVSAALGSLLGTLLTGTLAVAFGDLFKVHGAVMPFAENLLYSGYSHLDLTKIFISCIFLASSGALMDLAMDIASAIEEVSIKRPDLSKKEAIFSGLSVGRSVIGTMTTTLLLAYSGGYMSLLLVFMAQGTPVMNILNLKYVAAEIMHTLIGSIGLVTVAPFTALVAGLLLGRRDQRASET
ncbi:MAG: YibE/F family protein [Clostridiales bacterium]|jgi:uncharacterized membrane protein|nr:YibE/F family protein [Clostridiales bacterium]